MVRRRCRLRTGRVLYIFYRGQNSATQNHPWLHDTGQRAMRDMNLKGAVIFHEEDCGEIANNTDWRLQVRFQRVIDVA
ncbi:MAG: hypothetical protein KIS65_03025 [Nitrosomonas sp.]|nr:hypothetical protein [Nitrosomonas sp.]